MSRKRSLLLIQVLLFLLVTLLGVATGNLTKDAGHLPWAFEVLRRGSLPLAGVTVLLIIGLMVWQHVTEERLALPARPVWDSDRSPFPGLEAFTEQDSAVFFGREAEITELLDRLHPVVAAQANRLVAVVGPSGAGKSSLVQAGVLPRLRQRRGGWIVVPPVIPGDHPLRSLARSLAAAHPRHPTDDDLPAALGADAARLLRFVDGLRAAYGHPSHRTDGSWPLDREIGQSDCGMHSPASRSSSSVLTPRASTAFHGLRTANESPLSPGTEPPGYGTRRSASRILWPTHTAASPGN
jgi:hypothetical protein